MVLLRICSMECLSSSLKLLSSSLWDIRNFLSTRSLMEGLGLEKKAMETIFMMQNMYHKILNTIMKSIPSCEASVE